MLELLKDALEKAPVIKRGEYSYFINPLQGVSPPLKPDLLMEIARAIVKIADLDVDRIVTVEVMGIHISALVSCLTGIPLVIIRKKKFGLPGEVEIESEESYRQIAKEEEVKLYINSIRKGDRVLIIDDLMSEGGTVIGVIKGLEKVGAIVKDVVVVINRGRGPQRVKEGTGHDVKTLADVEVRGGKVQVLKMRKI
jgi:adenine phosphoribosyltransferase